MDGTYILVVDDESRIRKLLRDFFTAKGYQILEAEDGEKAIEVFEENRNLEYEYEINDEQDLSKQPMLKETKAILLNVFRDYLATPEQNQKIKQWLKEDREYLEKQKQEQYNSNVFEKNKKDEYLTGLYLHSSGSSPGLYSCDQL